jgi:hypothetical protein
MWVKLTTTHYMQQHADGLIAGRHGIRYRIACLPDARRVPAGDAATGEAEHVNCPACRNFVVTDDTDEIAVKPELVTESCCE